MILRNCCPPLVQVGKLGGLCSQVYAVLWESAYKDVRLDPSLHKAFQDRRNCGGTSEWTAKGIANELGSCRKRVGQSLDRLLDHGFVIAEDYFQDGRGSRITVWRVVHPDQLKSRKAAIDILGEPPSERRRKILAQKSHPAEPDYKFEGFLEADFFERFGTNPYKGWVDADSIK